MKKYTAILFLLFSSIGLSSFTDYNGINECYLTFNTPTGLTKRGLDKLPESAPRKRSVSTDGGVVDVTCRDGYRILYDNDKNVPFVNLKVELSENGEYDNDQQKLIANIKHLTSHSSGMETDVPLELNFNGYKIYGLSRTSIESGSILGTFIMFPGKGIVVYFYFNNLKPEYRNFNTVEDYKMQRDRFMKEYTNYLKSCRDN